MFYLVLFCVFFLLFVYLKKNIKLICVRNCVIWWKYYEKNILMRRDRLEIYKEIVLVGNKSSD